MKSYGQLLNNATERLFCSQSGKAWPSKEKDTHFLSTKPRPLLGQPRRLKSAARHQLRENETEPVNEDHTLHC